MSAPHGHPHGELHNPDTAHEASDINLRAVVTFVVLLTAITLTVQVAMYGLFHLFDHVERRNDPTVSPLATPADQAPPEPRLQTTPWTDLKELRTEELSYLHSYGWIDKDKGVAHMPIEKAEELLLQKGLPVRPGPADPTEGTSIATTGESSGGRNLPGAVPDTSTPSGSSKSPEGPKSDSQPPKKPGGEL